MATSVNRSLLFDVNLLTSNLHPPLSTSRYVEKHLLPNRNGGNRNAIIAESYVYTAMSTREHVHMLPNIKAAFNFHAPIASVVNVDDTPSHSNFPDNGNIELTRDGESNIRKLHDVDDSSSTHPSRQVSTELHADPHVSFPHDNYAHMHTGIEDDITPTKYKNERSYSRDVLTEEPSKYDISQSLQTSFVDIYHYSNKNILPRHTNALISETEKAFKPIESSERRHQKVYALQTDLFLIVGKNTPSLINYDVSGNTLFPTPVMESTTITSITSTIPNNDITQSSTESMMDSNHLMELFNDKNKSFLTATIMLPSPVNGEEVSIVSSTDTTVELNDINMTSVQIRPTPMAQVTFDKSTISVRLDEIIEPVILKQELNEQAIDTIDWINVFNNPGKVIEVKVENHNAIRQPDISSSVHHEPAFNTVVEFIPAGLVFYSNVMNLAQDDQLQFADSEYSKQNIQEGIITTEQNDDSINQNKNSFNSNNMMEILDKLIGDDKISLNTLHARDDATFAKFERLNNPKHDADQLNNALFSNTDQDDKLHNTAFDTTNPDD
ncbi:hypothetical protein DPMN_134112 [Dreissena polymorpha]|uniref:Uncharacterized protein n=1 Tax=Dreissena polymorpha TaxID=45954 RepID=A0A9D4JEL6_DREPO|nr:hypothetical protein DPMN_134112 [Dreissena polymorpha]